MKNFLTRLMTVACLAAMMVWTSGCIVAVAGVAAGAGAVVWMEGELKSTQSQPVEKCVPAVRAGLKDMGYGTPTESWDSGNQRFTTYASNGKKVQVTLVKLGPSSTEIRIRVGTFGDEQLSHQILTKIQSHLPAS